MTRLSTALAPSWAERHQRLVDARDLVLVDQARRRHPTVRWWWGQRMTPGGNGAYCYVCDELLVTWQRSRPMTLAARTAVAFHRLHHMAPTREAGRHPPLHRKGGRHG